MDQFKAAFKQATGKSVDDVVDMADSAMHAGKVTERHTLFLFLALHVNYRIRRPHEQHRAHKSKEFRLLMIPSSSHKQAMIPDALKPLWEMVDGLLHKIKGLPAKPTDQDVQAIGEQMGEAQAQVSASNSQGKNLCNLFPLSVAP